jgi:hypothetical protein
VHGNSGSHRNPTDGASELKIERAMELAQGYQE